MAKRLYRIALLDGTLRNDGTLARLEKDLLSILVNAYPKKEWKIQVERKFVHSRRSLEETLGLLRDRRRRTIGLHFVGHGSIRGTGTYLEVGNEEINLRDPDDLQLFEGIGVRWMLFSCCDIGSDSNTLRDLRKISKCDAVLAYQGIVYDYQAFVVDSMFYHLLLVDTPQHMTEAQMSWPLIRRRLGSAAKQLLTGAQIRASFKSRSKLSLRSKVG